MIHSVSHNLRYSIRDNTRQLNNIAHQVSHIKTKYSTEKPSVSLNRLMLEQRHIENHSKSSIKSFQIADNTLGYLLDTKA